MPTPQDLASYNQKFSQNLGGFLNSGAYQLSYGNNNASDPAERFMNDPGEQLALKASMNKVGNSYAAMGLGQSGALAKGLQDAMFSNYNGYLSNQNSLFGNYQGALGNLAALGQSVNGASAGLQNSQFLAGLLSNNFMTNANQQSNVYGTAGAELAAINQQLGSNIPSLLMSTASAKSQNMFNAYNLMYQLQAAQAASNAQSAGSAAAGAGYGQAAGMMGNPYGGGQSGAGGFGGGGYGTISQPNAAGQQTYSGNPWGGF